MIIKSSVSGCCLIFCKPQPGVAYESVAYKKKPVFVAVTILSLFFFWTSRNKGKFPQVLIDKFRHLVICTSLNQTFSRGQKPVYRPKYNFFLSPDILSARTDVKSEKVNFRPDIRQIKLFFEKNQYIKSSCGVALKTIWTYCTLINIKLR